MRRIIEEYFQLAHLSTSVRTEVRAGVSTFMTMAYIIFVNPAILKAAGVPVSGAVLSTCVVAGITSIAMGTISNYPFALASGMGLNAVVAYTIVQGMGHSWKIAMGAIVLEGILVTILVLTRVRETVMDAIPLSLKRAISVGIGLFIGFIGLIEGGIVVAHPTTLVGLGDFTRPHVWLSSAGLLLTSLLIALRIRGAILVGIVSTALLAIPLGIASPPRKFFSLPSDFSTFFQYDLIGAFSPSLAPVIFSLFMTDFFDTLGTVIGVGGQAGLLDEKGRLPRIRRVLLVDSLAAIMGGVCGASSATTYIESAAGVMEGGRSGLTSVVTGSLFLLSLFVIPLISFVAEGYESEKGHFLHPITAPALIIVGFLMMGVVTKIDFAEAEEGVPAFLTLITIPLTYSISHGIGLGFISHLVIQLCTGKGREVHPLLYIISLLFSVSFLIGR